MYSARIIHLLVVICLISLSFCYLELPLSRIPKSTKHIDNKLAACHVNLKDGAVPEGTYIQVCYLKDIAYVVELYNHDELLKLTVDMTTPMSWIKGPKCYTIPDNKQCTRVDKPLKEEVKQKLHQIESKVSRKKKHKAEQFNSNETLISIVGTQIVKGTLEKCENIEFWTKDSSKFASFYKLMLVGLFMSDEKDKIALRETNFINASQISDHLNQLCDGAISLRFDDESENSFLNQIFTYVAEPDKVVTVYIGENSSLTIGDLSIKNAEQGYSGITWIDLGSNKLLLLDQVSIQEEDSEKVKSVELNVQGLFSLSASYISFPPKQMSELLKQLNSGCQVMTKQNGYIQCDFSKKLLKKTLVLEINDTKIGLELEDLIKDKKSHKVLLNIRESQPENPYMILGEPVFKKYFTVFQYSKNRIGIALKRVTTIEKLFDVITLVRFLTFIFCTGCCFIICFRPIRRMIKTIRMRYKVNKFSSVKENDRTGLRYAHEEDNPYAEVSSKIQELVSDSNDGL